MSSQRYIAISCAVVEKALGDFDCCTSCHYDDEEGYGQLMGPSFGTRKYWYEGYLCCGGVKKFDEEEMKTSERQAVAKVIWNGRRKVLR